MTGPSAFASVVREQCPTTGGGVPRPEGTTTAHFTGSNAASRSPSGWWHAALIAALHAETDGSRKVVLWNPIPTSATTRTIPVAREKMIPMGSSKALDEESESIGSSLGRNAADRARNTLCDTSQWRSRRYALSGTLYRNGSDRKYVDRCMPFGQETRRGFRSDP